MMANSCLATLTLMALVLSPAPAGAQEANTSLRGITSLGSLRVEDLNDQARACGVNSDALDAAMRIPLSGTSLVAKIRERAPGESLEELTSRVLASFQRMGAPYLYVNVAALRLDTGLCIANIQVSLNRRVAFGVDGANEVAFAQVWSAGILISGPPSGFDKRATDFVEGATKRFIGAWLKAN